MRNRKGTSKATGAEKSRAAERGEAGFTLIELVVSLFVLVLILVGVLYLFDLNSRLARVETNVADMQQSLRIGQYDLVRVVRMAGRGGLAVWSPAAANGFAGKLLPTGDAIEVDDNVTGTPTIGGSGGPAVVAGTDILTVRGVFSGPVYSLNPINTADFSPPNANGNGVLIIKNVSPTGVPQSFGQSTQHDWLAGAIADANAGQQPAILFVSPLGKYAVAAIQAGSTISSGTATINYKIGSIGGSGAADDYLQLMVGATYPQALRTVAFAGVLQEYKYYIRSEPSVPGSPTSAKISVLSRAELYPNTNTPTGGDNANLGEDIADNVLDLQVAFGIDLNGNGIVDDQSNNATLTAATDEWMLNSPNDSTITWNVPNRPLLYLRVTTLAETAGAAPNYIAPAIQTIEDHAYNEPATPSTYAEQKARAHRRRELTTIVELRNLD